jgi:hypothetical protein
MILEEVLNLLFYIYILKKGLWSTFMDYGFFLGLLFYVFSLLFVLPLREKKAPIT